MNKMKSMLLVAVLALPLVSIGAASASATDESSAVASAPTTKPTGETSSIRCCWIFYLGSWYCIPC